MTNKPEQLTDVHLAVKSELDGYRIQAAKGQATAVAMVRLFESIDSELSELQERRKADSAEPIKYNIGGATMRFVFQPAGLTNVSDMQAVFDQVEVALATLYAAPQPAQVVPETLPCPVHLEPGLKFGKGVRTQFMLDALRRRADYYAELEAMTPEQRAEHDAGIAEFKAMLGGGFRDLSQPVDPQIAEYEKVMLQAGNHTEQHLEMVELSGDASKMVASNSPVTQDGWIPVSERMPPQGLPLLVCSGNGVVQRTVYGFDGENWLDWYEQYDPVKAEIDDLWQPLPAAPQH
ncbi:DUF551 domain-containing protein [Salmonella enterica subsp. enterica]|nr:DUF551 domain-containing protein [Salmonella enterica subsp. enterica]